MTEGSHDQRRGPGSSRRGRLLSLGAFGVYAAIAVLAYLPTLPLDGSHTQVCTCGDSAQEVWLLGWVPFALTHGHSLFYSNWILYPSGVNLMDNTSMPLLGLLATPVTLLAGPIAAYNLILRAGFALSALAMFLTVRRLVRWWPAAFLAGLLYGFSPFMVGQGLSHEFLVFAPIPPLVFGILHDVLGEGRMPARRAGLWLGLLFAAQFLIASETFVVMALMSAIGVAVAMCYPSARQRTGALTRTAGWAAGACAAVIAYPAYMFIAGPRHIVGPPHPLGVLYAWHGDLLGALVPGPLARLAPPGLLHLGASMVAHNVQENGTYLGLPLILLTVGLVIAFRRHPVTAVSGVLALVSYALSLGTRIDLANHPTPVPGPFSLLARLPVLQDIEPARFSLFTALFVAVVLGTGLDQWRYRATAGHAAGQPASGQPRRPLSGTRAADWRRPAAVAAVGVAALVPLLPRWPYPVGPVVTPSFFTTAAADRIRPGTVVATYPFPDHHNRNEALVWQALASMRFRLVGGRLSSYPGPVAGGSTATG